MLPAIVALEVSWAMPLTTPQASSAATSMRERARHRGDGARDERRRHGGEAEAAPRADAVDEAAERGRQQRLAR